MYLEKLNYNNKYELNKVKKFLLSFELEFDKGVDHTITLYENDELIGTVSKEKNIIKCFAIDYNQQGRGLANVLLTNIRNKMLEEGYISSMVFTKAENKFLFEDMGYIEVAKTDKVILLEQGSDINKTIDDIIIKNNIDINKKRAMIIMNCNPFTLGHQYLIETASKQNEEVIIFILEEDKSTFPFKLRYEMVKEGTKHLKNVLVLPSTKYIISSVTFPTYFIKEKSQMLEQYTKLDSEIVSNIFCKKLNINIRYLGTEPKCGVTFEYNQMIKEILPKYGIEIKEIERKKVNDTVISASKVREYIDNKDIENLKKIVPDTTFHILI